MNDELNPILRQRLERLAQVVPIAEPRAEAAPFVRGAVVRSRALPGLGAVAVAAVVVGIALWEGATGRFATPGASPTRSATSAPSDQAPIGRASDGTFELTISSPKTHYAALEPIEVEASLTYLGPETSIRIAHGQGAASGPMSFGIEEPVIGDLVLGPSWRLSCEHSILGARDPLVVAFAKSGGYTGDDPRAADYGAFFADQELRLGPGTWHVYVVTDLDIGDCGGEHHELRAEITIAVGTSEPVVVTSEPPSTFPGVCANLGVTPNKCAGFAAWAVGQAGIEPGHVQRIEMSKVVCPGGRACATQSVGYLFNVHLVTDAGVASDEVIDCTRIPMSLGAINFLCDSMTNLATGEVIEYPLVHSAISGGYHDTPCAGEAPENPCATPLPTIDPSAMAASTPLEIGTLQIPIDHTGRYSVVLGQASLPNGILTAASAKVTSSPWDPLVAYEGYQLVVKSLDGGPAFENYYQHGWRPGTERVQVSLEFTVLMFAPGVTVEVSNVDVH